MSDAFPSGKPMVFKATCLIGRHAACVLSVTLAVAGCGGASTGSSSSPTATDGTDAVALSQSQYQVAAASSLAVAITRSGSGNGAASAGYATSAASAVENVDYAASAGTVSWAQGDLLDKVVLIPAAASAAGKAFSILLVNPTGDVHLGSPVSATVQIVASSATTAVPSPARISTGSPANADGTRAATLSWVAPSQNTDGSTLTDLAGFDIYYGNDASMLSHRIVIAGSGQSSYTVEGLNSGSWYFAVSAVNAIGVESDPSAAIEAVL